MGEIYISIESVPSAWKRKILELIEHSPSTGEISVTLHKALHFSGAGFEHVEPPSTYDYGTDRRQIEPVIESVDRLIESWFARVHRYGSVIINVNHRTS